jgi:hypothetical protein
LRPWYCWHCWLVVYFFFKRGDREMRTYLVGKSEGSRLYEYYGGLPSDHAAAFMREYEVSSCYIQGSGTWLATVGGVAKHAAKY